VIRTKLNKLLGQLLESRFIGFIFSFLIRPNFINFRGSEIFVKNLDHKNYIRILFSYYESAEIKLIKKYFNINLPTIDLGSGIGATMCTFAHKSKKKIICVEASKFCVEQLKINVKKNNFKNFKILNKLFFSHTNINKPNYIFNEKKDFIFSKLLKKKSNKKINKKKTITLNNIFKKFNFKKVQISCDIEGEELHFNKKDFMDLKKCENLIIEIHSNNQSKINQFIYNLKKISNLQLKEKKHSVYYFKRIIA
tara:strand:+ start:1138 stop:1893 length:756 start_codon:yes stop_codon:yes gene_type:complete